MEAVNVLRGIDRVEHPLLGVGAHSLRQRRLHQDPIDLVVGVEPADQREGVLEGRTSVDAKQLRPAARRGHGLELVANVDLGGRILASQHHAQPRGPAVALDKRGNARSDLVANASGAGGAV